jgi:hypothetical protein
MGKNIKTLEALKQKQEALKNKITQVEAKAKVVAKKQDLRRKILLGAYFLEQAEKEGSVKELYQKLDGFLTRNSDRVLFDLPLLENNSKKSSGKKLLVANEPTSEQIN